MNFLRFIAEWINANPGRAIGGFVGFLVGIFFLTIGVLKTLLVVIFISVGYFIGKSRDEKRSIIDNIRSIFKR